MANLSTRDNVRFNLSKNISINPSKIPKQSLVEMLLVVHLFDIEQMHENMKLSFITHLLAGGDGV